MLVSTGRDEGGVGGQGFLRSFLRAVLLFVISVSAASAADRTIYLTFDDGPLPGTGNILAVLQKENVPAAMFMVGLHVETQPKGRSLLADAKALPLVTVGNHSYSHANNRYKVYYSNTSAVIADMLRANRVLGLTVPARARLPGRNVFRLQNVFSDDLSINVRQWEKEWLDYELVAAAGFRIYGWDFEWVHSDDGAPVQTVAHLMDEIDHLFRYGRFTRKGKMILLMHDEMFQDKFNGTDNLTALIRGLGKRGYVFGDIATFED